MTRRVLLALLEVRGGALVWCAVLLALPLLLPVAAIADLLSAQRRANEEREVLSQTEARCPRRHAVALYGAYRCAACGLTSERSGFQACPHCATVAAAIGCPCGLPVRNPLWRPEEA
ncbi:MAG: hypothetical protein Q8P41_18590 [Pseudomonadota bacterium]|nr:hypothetical protein [Pseudomonadota bacterium]